MAAEKVEIFCTFHNSDMGRLRLIDIPGLVDTRKGDTEQLVRALGDKLQIERWSFWVFNHDSRKSADNLTQCESLRASINNAQIRVSGTAIVDCTNYEDVSSGLIDKVLDFLAGNIESIDADMFDILFGKLWKELAIGIQSCVGQGSELRDAKGTPREPLKERIEAIFTEAESGASFTFTDEEIRKENERHGDTKRAYIECLHILRTQLSTRMQEDMDDILSAVMTAMKDKFGHILGHEGRLAGKFGCDNHEILGRLIEYIRGNNLSDRDPTLLYGLELLDGWRLN